MMKRILEGFPSSHAVYVSGPIAGQERALTEGPGWINLPPVAQVDAEDLTGDPAHDLGVFLRAIDEANADV